MLELKNITMKFPENTLFNGFSYKFEKNKTYGLLGKSGCGKSTLLRIMSGLIKPTEGEVLCNGKKVSKEMSDIFMMHQAYTNFPWKNCLDNILFPVVLRRKITQEDTDRALELLRDVELSDYAEKYPYDMSGGMNQRLALARVVMAKPHIILMDEPLSALDPTTRRSMQNLIKKWDKEWDNIIIMVTHDPNEAEMLCDVLINLTPENG